MPKDKQKIFEEVPCNLCGSKEYSIIYTAKYNAQSKRDISVFRASSDELLVDQLVKCKRCGLIYINPRIKSNFILKSYSQGSDEIFVSQAKYREKTFDSSLNIIEKFKPKQGNILDIGTAGGSFLAAAKKRAWNVYGCEPNKWLANWGNKNYSLNIKSGTLFEQKYKKEFFDVVTLWDVIEHTPDPEAVLKQCNNIIKDNGFLVVNYPDIGSWIAKIMGRKWLFLTSVHLYYFTRKTIKEILRKNGFEIIIMKPHIQKLQAGYIFSRAEKYNKLISKIGMSIVRALNFADSDIPYWLGQTFVIARKIGQ